MLRSRFKRKYKEININYFVRICKKEGKCNEMKEHIKNWTHATYEVVGIDKSGLKGKTTYKLEGLPKGYLKNELLLVE